MHFKLIVAFVDERRTEEVIRAAREAGATGITQIHSAHGEGVEPQKTFLGLNLEVQRNVLLMVVEEHLSRAILERICEAGCFETEHGQGIALQVDVEDAVGVSHQVVELAPKVEEEL